MKPDEAARIALGPAGPASRAHRFAHEAMATVFEILCVHDDPGYAGQAAHEAFALLDRLEQEMSRFVPNSDVSRINALSAGGNTRVGAATLQCLEIARYMFELTGGAFDVSIGSGFEKLDLGLDDFTVHAHADGIRLDLGGIGKGYAVDRMAELLEEWEIRRALVHGGFSSVLALEPPPDEEGWPLVLRVPGQDAVLTRISARQMALSASGTQKGDHVVDPGTGLPVRGRAAWAALSSVGPADASAQTSPAAVAEGFSTAFLILPDSEVEELCRRCPGLQAWII
jgi:FAD:protein FMN transferase